MLFSQSSENRHSFTKCVLSADPKAVTVLNPGETNIKSPVSIPQEIYWLVGIKCSKAIIESMAK